MKRLSKKDKIIDSTLKLIAKNNTMDITVREIAHEAKVNVAAINYYFSSKEQLFLEVNTLFMENFNDAMSILDKEYDSSEKQLVDWLFKIIDYAIYYPGMFNILIDKIKNEHASAQDVEIVSKLWSCIAKVFSLFEEVVKPEEGEELSTFLLFASSIVFPCMIASYGLFDEFELSTDDGRMKLINMTLNIFRR